MKTELPLNENTPEIDQDGNKRWRNTAGELHRVDGPAIERADGTKEWLQHGMLHRDGDLPATERASGFKEWFRHGEQYVPALSLAEQALKEATPEIDHYGVKRWRNTAGELHRTDGPALECPNGDKVWYQHGELHRVDGPAIERADGGTDWYQHGDLHRTDGPAIEHLDGGKVWYQHGEIHRIDGPAGVSGDGTQHWYKEGELHRTGAPAIEYADGGKAWYREGRLHHTDGPALEESNGSKEWHQHGQLHRTDGPAVARYDGHKEWHQDGKLHRVDGPAIEHSNGRQDYYRNGEKFIPTLVPALISPALLAEQLGRVGIAADASPGEIKIVLDSPITIEVRSTLSVRQLFRDHGEQLMKAAGARAGEIVFLATKADGQVPAYVTDRALQKVGRDALAGKTTLTDVVAGALTPKTPAKQVTRDRGR